MSQHKIQSVIVLDVETGGLSCLKNPMTQVALQSFSLYDGTIISKYDSFVQPYGGLVYEDAALKFTGITYAMINGGKHIKHIVEALCEQFTIANTARTHTKKPIIVGHNVMFDIGFIQWAFNFCKVDLSKYLDCKVDAFGNPYPSFLCTMWMSRMTWGGDTSMTKFNLTVCCEKAGISLVDAHGAPNDVEATKELVLYFMKRMRSEGGGQFSTEVDGDGTIVKQRPRKHFQF